MSTKNFYQNYIDLVLAIEICLERKLQVPSMILLYTLMDTFAWVVFGEVERGSRSRFERWVNTWLLPQGKFRCTATDLYAARCAVLHTLTSQAALTETGAAREVLYAWGTATADKLQETIEMMGKNTYVGVHMGELFAATREAIAKVIEKAEEDEHLAQRLQMAASKHFANIENEKVDQFIDMYGNAKAS